MAQSESVSVCFSVCHSVKVKHFQILHKRALSTKTVGHLTGFKSTPNREFRERVYMPLFVLYMCIMCISKCICGFVLLTGHMHNMCVCICDLAAACICPSLIEKLLLQFRGWREEGPRQGQRRSPSGVFGGGEESPEEEARPEERTTRGLHGQLLRWLGNLPDQDAGQIFLSQLRTISTSRLGEYKSACCIYTAYTGIIIFTELPGQKLLQPPLPGAFCRLCYQLHSALLQSKPEMKAS